MRNKEGWFVRYEPHIRMHPNNNTPNESESPSTRSGQDIRIDSDYSHSNTFVFPKVDGNSIEWTLPNGVVAKYTALKDRIKADYTVKEKSSLCHSGPLRQSLSEASLSRISLHHEESERDSGVSFDSAQDPQNDDCKSSKLDFIVEYNDSSSPQGEGALHHDLLPDGSIVWLAENGGEIFSMPKPVIQPSSVIARSETTKQSQIDGIATPLDKLGARNDKKKEFGGQFAIQKTGQGTSLLSINIPDNVEYPLIIDPVVVDSAATSAATGYGNGRKLLRDAWGNLIMLCDCGTGDDNVYYKNKSDENANAGAWTDAAVDIDDQTTFSQTIAGDIDSAGNVHVALADSSVARKFMYDKLTVTRNSSNNITSITDNATNLNIDSITTTGERASLIIANKGEGSGKEKVALAWGINSTGGTVRGEIRFLQCDVADNCFTAANWKNASEEKNGNGACSDTDTTGDKGLPANVTCKGAADAIFTYTVANTSHHVVLIQVSGRPARPPTTNGVFKDINGTLTSLPNANDDNTGTTGDVSSLTTTDYIYVGDTTKFSRIVADITNTNSNAQTFTTRQYCSANSNVNDACDTWSAVANFIDNTATSTIAFNEDGSILFDEPSGWIESTEGPGGSTVKGFWVRLRPDGAFDATVSIAEIEVTDRHSKDLMIAGGVNATDDLGAAYVIWDFVGNAGWENNPASTAVPWRADAGGTSSALSDTGGNWGTFTNFPLTATVDPINNNVYVAFVDDLATDALTVKRVPVTLDVTVAANWSDTALPAVTEGADIVLSLTSDQSDIYLFYVLDPHTNSLVWRKCTPSGGGDGNICDVAADWGSEIRLSNFVSTTEEPGHPQAIVSKAFGDTVALDVVYTNLLATATVEYERHFVDMANITKAVTVSGDDAVEDKCISVSTDSQTISGTTVKLGGEATFGACSSGGVNHHVGFHFPSISVGQGANISSSYIDFRVSARTGGGTAAAFTVYGEDTNDSAAFAAVADPCGATCINGRTKTTSSSSQSIDFSTNSYRIDVTNMVQEIVCRGINNTQPCVGNFDGNGLSAWASGQALAILLISTVGASNNNASIDAFDATGTVMLDPTLQINCEGACSGTTAGRNYTMGVLNPPTGTGTSGDLDHPVSSIQFGQIGTDDTLYASVSASMVPSASSSASPIFMFKAVNSNGNNTDDITVSVIVRSTIPTKSYGGPHSGGKQICLQVYDTSSGWANVGSCNTTTVADTDITLSGTVTGATTKYQSFTPGGSCTGSDCWVTLRVYQDASISEGNQVLYADFVSFTFVPENVLWLLPFAMFLPRIVSWYNKRRQYAPIKLMRSRLC